MSLLANEYSWLCKAFEDLMHKENQAAFYEEAKAIHRACLDQYGFDGLIIELRWQIAALADCSRILKEEGEIAYLNRLKCVVKACQCFADLSINTMKELERKNEDSRKMKEYFRLLASLMNPSASLVPVDFYLS